MVPYPNPDVSGEYGDTDDYNSNASFLRHDGAYRVWHDAASNKYHVSATAGTTTNSFRASWTGTNYQQFYNGINGATGQIYVGHV